MTTNFTPDEWTTLHAIRLDHDASADARSQIITPIKWDGCVVIKGIYHGTKLHARGYTLGMVLDRDQGMVEFTTPRDLKDALARITPGQLVRISYIGEAAGRKIFKVSDEGCGS
jgi:hypothetical protein